MKPASSHPPKPKLASKTSRKDRPGDRRHPAPANSNSKRMTGNASADQIALDQADFNRIKELPKEVGVMLITAGIVGLILPGPGTPAIIAGGLALWPSAFGKLEAWLARRYPGVHRQSMKQINRFLNDLEKRYPYSKPS